MLSLDVRRARKGDCLLLHFGSKDDPAYHYRRRAEDVYRPNLSRVSNRSALLVAFPIRIRCRRSAHGQPRR